MKTFGFSAFLKLVSLNDRPQQTEIRRRLNPTSGGGYDFHSSLRRLAHRFLVDHEAMPILLGAASNIARLPERASAIAALERLEAWRVTTPGQILNFAPVTFESPRRVFRVRFEPDFGIRIRGRTAAIHIWNTMRSRLAVGPVYAALALVSEAAQAHQTKPDDFGVLSLREPSTLYLLSDAPNMTALSSTLVERIENLIQPPAPPFPQPEDRPQI